VIAEYLRLRAHKLRVVAPYPDETRALRTVVRTRGDLVQMRVAATNQLSALLDAHWPGAVAIFADVESPVSLEFKLHNRLLRPLLAADQAQAPPELRAALRAIDQHIGIYITRARLSPAA
jgi:transposase